jgi:hypothetical protein
MHALARPDRRRQGKFTEMLPVPGIACPRSDVRKTVCQQLQNWPPEQQGSVTLAGGWRNRLQGFRRIRDTVLQDIPGDFAHSPACPDGVA